MKSLFRLVYPRVDINNLLLSIKENEGLWEKRTARQDTKGSAHKDTQTIFLRWARDLSIDTVFTDLVAFDYPELEMLAGAREIIKEVMKRTQSTKLARVILVKLKPFGEIPEHCDEGLYAETYERFHLCLSSSAGNLFYNERESVQMKSGQIWHFNHQKPHKVINNSESPRIHMIIDTISPYYRSLRLTNNQEHEVRL